MENINEYSRIMYKIRVELDLFEKMTIDEVPVNVEEVKSILSQTLTLFKKLKNGTALKINLIEEIYQKIFELRMGIGNHTLIEINDMEINAISQEIVKAFYDCFISLKYFFAQYSSTCNWSEETTKILQVRSGFEFLHDIFQNVDDKATQAQESNFNKLLSKLESFDELKEFDYKLKNWENCFVLWKEIPTNIPRTHFWWFPKEDSIKVNLENSSKRMTTTFNISSKQLQIYKVENGKYRVDLKALNSVLDQVGNKKVAIYSINGPLRNGKSFILGFFLKYLNCDGKGDWINSRLDSTFTFRGGSKRETTGIFMWSKPFFIKKGGEDIALLLMDTQGSFDSETTMQENAIVFALSTLLSSFIMFNIKEQISEDILQFLQYFAGFARLAEEENNDEPFQKLIFLIRDWQKPDYDYGYYDDKNAINGQNFKKDYINVRDSQPTEVQFVHNMILSTFNDVGCYLMPHPGPQVARHSNADVKSFDPDFLTHLKEFIPLIFRSDNIIEKKIGGSYVTGNDLKMFVNKWAKIFKSDEMPKSKTVFEATAELQNEMAKSAAIDNYVRKMKEFVISCDNTGLENSLIEDIHRQVLGESLKLYKSFRKIGGKEYEEAYTAKILKEVETQYQYFLQMNQSNRRINEIQTTMQSKCDQLLKETEDNKQKLMNMQNTSEAEKAEFMRQIEESNNQLEKIKVNYQDEIDQLKDQIAVAERNSNAARSAGRASWFQEFISDVVEVLQSVAEIMGLNKGSK